MSNALHRSHTGHRSTDPHANWNRDYSSLSVYDLLLARDSRHAQYARNPNVIGTAIGRYLIRTGEEHVAVGRDADLDAVKKIRAAGKQRTAANARVTRDSWPCVLVFVREMRPPSEVPADEYIDPFIVVETDRPPRVVVAPVCVVAAPTEPAAARSYDVQPMPPSPVGGGYPVFANVQGRRHVGTIACIVTDGRTRYALTNRHVAGPPGTEIYPSTSLRTSRLGQTATSIGRLPFNDVWPLLPPSRSTAPLDAALIELDEMDDVTAKVFRPKRDGGRGDRPLVPMGSVLGPIVDIDEVSLDLDWIGYELRGFGAVSGPMSGRVIALLYRYIDEGGTDYTVDLMIASDDGTATMHPGDSGTLWTFVDHRDRERPIALQWGGEHHKFSYGERRQTFAMATFVSNATRALEVRVEADLNVEGPEYWGQTGHFIIGDLAPDFVRDADLRAFFQANRELLSNNPKDPWKIVRPSDFVGLADVPDLVWRNTRMRTEGPNHYIDLDLTGYDKLADKTVSQVLTESDYDPQAVQDLYDDANTDPHRPLDTHKKDGSLKDFDGMLPWRVGQLFNVMAGAVASGDLDLFFVAAGTCAHYVGDGCQSLHGAKWTNGRPGEPPGAHGAYEDDMLDDNDDFDQGLRAYVTTNLPKRTSGTPPATGKEAAKAVHALLSGTQALLPPDSILDAYQTLLKEHTSDTGRRDKIGIAQGLWQQFGEKTNEAIFGGCDTLALVWEGAWKAGAARRRAKTPSLGSRGKPVLMKPQALSQIVADHTACPSYSLDKMIADHSIWE